MLIAHNSAAACPFCNAVRPSFAQLRESADAVVLGEVVETSREGNAAKPAAADAQLTIRIRNVLKGSDVVRIDTHIIARRVEPMQAGALCLVWGNQLPANSSDSSPDKSAVGDFDWTYRPVTETSYAYFARAPELRVAPAERLRYFARFLEHPDASIADDAYLEFGHAPFDVVAQAADALPLDKIRRWLLDDRMPQERKGFYGLALGLARDPALRAANAELLRGLVNEPEDDFRAGFGGILGGYLLAAGPSGLNLIDQRYLSNPGAADGDVRSALSALRFYHEYGKEISIERQQASLRQLLERREFAAEAIVDLSRWQDWSALARVAKLYAAPADVQPAARRAVVGYLTACPIPAAAESLARLRENDPRGVREAEAYLKAFGSVR